MGAHRSAPEQLSFLPPPPFAPTYPAKHTLEGKALQALLNGESISHPQFEGATGSWRLGAVIFTLRMQGWPIEAVTVPTPTPEAPTRWMAAYSLPNRFIVLARQTAEAARHGT
ncbi:hypothetical protein C5F52_10905 [Limnohabitans sp. TS-CS-82]|uniref:hypothetical protein n=1 Tax=Limnohabitans sp. TS-CS-82 TaxID=2094193 RepID=UPI000CF23508|nr:hypothetical protein [Limnohabitans sp. TS-CS-82]PQA83204.1 hypothetical protein C5F52_10905 [Limnohabitans sp. TS-CS-82]